MPSNNTPSQEHYNKSLRRREYDVFSPDALTCFTVPSNVISHYGDEGKRMMICRNYSHAVASGARGSNPAAGGCQMAHRCKFVHIDVPLSSLRSEHIHTHYVWRDVDCVTYERLAPALFKQRSAAAAAGGGGAGKRSGSMTSTQPSSSTATPAQSNSPPAAAHGSATAAGTTTGASQPLLTEEAISRTILLVLGPNNKEPAEEIPAGRVLLTIGGERAFGIAIGERQIDITKASPHPCHCAHYYFNQVCNRGASCGFVHVISTSPHQSEDFTRQPNFHKRLEVIGSGPYIREGSNFAAGGGGRGIPPVGSDHPSGLLTIGGSSSSSAYQHHQHIPLHGYGQELNQNSLHQGPMRTVKQPLTMKPRGGGPNSNPASASASASSVPSAAMSANKQQQQQQQKPQQLQNPLARESQMMTKGANTLLGRQPSSTTATTASSNANNVTVTIGGKASSNSNKSNTLISHIAADEREYYLHQDDHHENTHDADDGVLSRIPSAPATAASSLSASPSSAKGKGGIVKGLAQFTTFVAPMATTHGGHIIAKTTTATAAAINVAAAVGGPRMGDPLMSVSVGAKQTTPNKGTATVVGCSTMLLPREDSIDTSSGGGAGLSVAAGGGGAAPNSNGLTPSNTPTPALFATQQHGDFYEFTATTGPSSSAGPAAWGGGGGGDGSLYFYNNSNNSTAWNLQHATYHTSVNANNNNNSGNGNYYYLPPQYSHQQQQQYQQLLDVGNNKEGFVRLPPSTHAFPASKSASQHTDGTAGRGVGVGGAPSTSSFFLPAPHPEDEGGSSHGQQRRSSSSSFVVVGSKPAANTNPSTNITNKNALAATNANPNTNTTPRTAAAACPPPPPPAAFGGSGSATSTHTGPTSTATATVTANAMTALFYPTTVVAQHQQKGVVSGVGVGGASVVPNTNAAATNSTNHKGNGIDNQLFSTTATVSSPMSQCLPQLNATVSTVAGVGFQSQQVTQQLAQQLHKRQQQEGEEGGDSPSPNSTSKRPFHFFSSSTNTNQQKFSHLLYGNNNNNNNSSNHQCFSPTQSQQSNAMFFVSGTSSVAEHPFAGQTATATTANSLGGLGLVPAALLQQQQSAAAAAGPSSFEEKAPMRIHNNDASALEEDLYGFSNSNCLVTNTMMANNAGGNFSDSNLYFHHNEAFGGDIVGSADGVGGAGEGGGGVFSGLGGGGGAHVDPHRFGAPTSMGFFYVPPATFSGAPASYQHPNNQQQQQYLSALSAAPPTQSTYPYSSYSLAANGPKVGEGHNGGHGSHTNTPSQAQQHHSNNANNNNFTFNLNNIEEPSVDRSSYAGVAGPAGAATGGDSTFVGAQEVVGVVLKGNSSLSLPPAINGNGGLAGAAAAGGVPTKVTTGGSSKSSYSHSHSHGALSGAMIGPEDVSAAHMHVHGTPTSIASSSSGSNTKNKSNRGLITGVKTTDDMSTATPTAKSTAGGSRKLNHANASTNNENAFCVDPFNVANLSFSTNSRRVTTPGRFAHNPYAGTPVHGPSSAPRSSSRLSPSGTPCHNNTANNCPMAASGSGGGVGTTTTPHGTVALFLNSSSQPLPPPHHHQASNVNGTHGGVLSTPLQQYHSSAQRNLTPLLFALGGGVLGEGDDEQHGGGNLHMATTATNAIVITSEVAHMTGDGGNNSNNNNAMATQHTDNNNNNTNNNVAAPAPISIRKGSNLSSMSFGGGERERGGGADDDGEDVHREDTTSSCFTPFLSIPVVSETPAAITVTAVRASNTNTATSITTDNKKTTTTFESAPHTCASSSNEKADNVATERKGQSSTSSSPKAPPSTGGTEHEKRNSPNKREEAATSSILVKTPHYSVNTTIATAVSTSSKAAATASASPRSAPLHSADSLDGQKKIAPPSSSAAAAVLNAGKEDVSSSSAEMGGGCVVTFKTADVDAECAELQGQQGGGLRRVGSHHGGNEGGEVMQKEVL